MALSQVRQINGVIANPRKSMTVPVTIIAAIWEWESDARTGSLTHSSIVSFGKQLRSLKAAFEPSEELNRMLKVYGFSACVEPCCGFQVPAE